MERKIVVPARDKHVSSPTLDNVAGENGVHALVLIEPFSIELLGDPRGFFIA